MKIVKSGNFNGEWNAKCPRCGCEFTYRVKDIRSMHRDTVSCPECLLRIDVTDRDKKPEATEGTGE